MTNLITDEELRQAREIRVDKKYPLIGMRQRLVSHYGEELGNERFKIFLDANRKYWRRELDDILNRARGILGAEGVRELLKEATEHETANDN